MGMGSEFLRGRCQEKLVVIEDIGQLRGLKKTGSLNATRYQVLFTEGETNFQE